MEHGQDSNIESPAFLNAVQKNLLTGFRHIETTLRSKEGHVFVGGTPSADRGIWILVVPDSEVVQADVGVVDLFHLGLKPSSVRAMLQDLSQGRTYQTASGDTQLWMQDANFCFRFHYKHLPEQEFNVTFNRFVSVSLVKWFSHHSGTKRNALCPCDTGKKFRECCAHMALVSIPPHRNIEDLIDKEADHLAHALFDGLIRVVRFPPDDRSSVAAPCGRGH